MTALKGDSFDVFLNRGRGEFEDGSVSSRLLGLSQPVSGWGCGLVDLDNDGWLDLFVAGRRRGHRPGNEKPDIQECRRQVHRCVRQIWSLGAPRVCIEAVSLPILTAMAVLMWQSAASMGRLSYGGTRSPVQHWLQLRLTGTRSNRSAIGAQVTLNKAQGTKFAV